MTRDDCILLGSISKTHGVRGEMILRTDKGSVEPDENWESLFIEIEGIMVPFFISELYNIREGVWVLGLEDIAGKNKAESLTGHSVWIPRDGGAPPDTISFKQMAGFTLHDRSSGKSGLIREVIDIPGNPVFDVVIDNESHLVPVQQIFILDMDTAQKTIFMNLPEGLF